MLRQYRWIRILLLWSLLLKILKSNVTWLVLLFSTLPRMGLLPSSEFHATMLAYKFPGDCLQISALVAVSRIQPAIERVRRDNTVFLLAHQSVSSAEAFLKLGWDENYQPTLLYPLNDHKVIVIGRTCANYRVPNIRKTHWLLRPAVKQRAMVSVSLMLTPIGVGIANYPCNL